MADSNTKKFSGNRIILLIFGVLVLSALPLLIFRPVKQNEPVPNVQKRFTFMTNTPRTEKDLHNLSYWEKAGNPELFAKPDAKTGYPAFSGPEIKDLKPAGSDVNAFPQQGWAPGKIGLPEERTPGQLLVQIRIPLNYAYRVEKMKMMLVKAPVFLLESGEIFPVPGFKQPDSDVKELIPTILSVRKTAKDLPPEISVQRSCGDSRLDNAAMRALFFHAAVNEKVKDIIKVEWSNEVGK